MKLTIRPSNPEDESAIVVLLREAGLKPIAEPRALFWKYWQERADWPGPRSFVLVKGDAIVAHVGIVPGACCWDAHRVPLVHMIDWAASVQAAGAGVSLLKHLRRLADGLLAIDGNADTLRVLPVLGFQRHGTATGYVRVLHPRSYPRRSARAGWKTLPHFLRRVLWALIAPGASAGRWHARQLAPDQVQRVAAVLPRARAGSVVMERSVALLKYFLDCPIAPMTLYALEQGTTTRGYFILAAVPRQAILIDCWVDTDLAADWLALINCIVDTAARMPGVAELITLAGDAMLARCLVKSGFHARQEKPIQLLMRKGTEGPPACPRVQMIESDGAYTQIAHGEFWA